MLFHGLLQDGCVYFLVLENNDVKKRYVCFGSSSYLGRGDELDEVLSDFCLLLDLICSTL
jgi:hypothetical protein